MLKQTSTELRVEVDTDRNQELRKREVNKFAVKWPPSRLDEVEGREEEVEGVEEVEMEEEEEMGEVEEAGAGAEEEEEVPVVLPTKPRRRKPTDDSKN